MDSTIIAAVIGGLFTVGAAIGTLLITRLFDNVSLFPRSARQISLNGHWEGTVHQEGGSQGAPLDYALAFTLKSTPRMVQGEGSLPPTAQNQNAIHITAKGRLVYDRFLKLEYEFGERPGLIQFGLILLELSPDGQTLEGRFVGFGATVSRGLVCGTLQAHKRGSMAHISASSQPVI